MMKKCARKGILCANLWSQIQFFKKVIKSYDIQFHKNIILFCPNSQSEIEVEEYEKMDPALKCPPQLLEILIYQSCLPPPSLHVRYMKFCEVSGDGFIGRKILVVTKLKI